MPWSSVRHIFVSLTKQKPRAFEILCMEKGTVHFSTTWSWITDINSFQNHTPLKLFNLCILRLIPWKEIPFKELLKKFLHCKFLAEKWTAPFSITCGRSTLVIKTDKQSKLEIIVRNVRRKKSTVMTHKPVMY